MKSVIQTCVPRDEVLRGELREQQFAASLTKTPFLLSEELGVRLGLLMLAVKPLRKSSRMTDISEQVQSMASEEAYYWFSKTTDHHLGRRSQKAMRILLAKE